MLSWMFGEKIETGTGKKLATDLTQCRVGKNHDFYKKNQKIRCF